MSIYLRLLPGVKIRIGKRGVRWSLGPRAARVHAGGGYRAGVSTGAGPFTAYRSVGSGYRKPQKRPPLLRVNYSVTVPWDAREWPQGEPQGEPLGNGEYAGELAVITQALAGMPYVGDAEDIEDLTRELGEVAQGLLKLAADCKLDQQMDADPDITRTLDDMRDQLQEWVRNFRPED
jgi:hypothetical protein